MANTMKVFYATLITYTLSFSNLALASEYTALINCGPISSAKELGASYVDNCFYESDLKITINKTSTIYNVQTGNYPNKSGYDKNGSLAIDLGNDFSIRARNSSDGDILTIRIFDDTGNMVFQDQASKYQSIYVKHEPE